MNAPKNVIIIHTGIPMTGLILQYNKENMCRYYQRESFNVKLRGKFHPPFPLLLIHSSFRSIYLFQFILHRIEGIAI